MNHFNIYQIFKRLEIICPEISINEMVELIYMVPEIMKSNDRPNPTSWFWFNQWPNRSHLYTPGKPKAHISWLCEQNWNSKSRLGFLRSQSQIACEPQNWKLWKTNQPNEMALVWWKTTQIRQLNENKIFLQREFVQFRKIKFFPANIIANFDDLDDDGNFYIFLGNI